MVIQTIGRGSSGYKEALGELGTGLGSLAGTLIGAKLANKNRQQQEHDLASAYIASGVPAAKAHAMARADANTRNTFYQQHVAQGGLANAPEEQTEQQQYKPVQTQQPNSLANLAALRVQQETPQFKQQQQYQNVLGALGGRGVAQGPEAAEAGLRNISNANALSLLQGPKKQQELSEQGLKNLLKAGQAQQLPQQAVPVMQQQPQPVAAKPKIPTPEEQLIDSTQRKALIKDALGGGNNAASSWKKLMSAPSQKEIAEQKKREFEEKKFNQIEEKTALAETKEYYNNTLKAAKAAEADEHILDRMSELEETGSLPWTAAYNYWKDLSEKQVTTHIPVFGKLIDIVLSGVVNKSGDIASGLQRRITARDTEEYEKLSASFLKSIGQYFKGSISQVEIENFLKTIPTLSQTQSGRMAIIRNMQSSIQLAKKEAEIMKDVIRQNGGQRPKDLQFRVDEEMRPYKDEFAQQFRQGATIKL